MQAPGSQDPLAQRTRERLAARLRELRRGASTRELADSLGLHVNGVRRHLEILESAGLVERRRIRARRGRPRSEWSLVPGARPSGAPPRRYGDLARWLTRAVESGSREIAEIAEQGRAIGLELAPGVAEATTGGGSEPAEPAQGGASAQRRFRDALTALGFDPVLEPLPEGRVRCRLCNCPYLDSARESPRVICTLHRGMTAGLLQALEPSASLEVWEPQEPGEAGCVAEIAGTGWGPELSEADQGA